jgi:hypothetical protein
MFPDRENQHRLSLSLLSREDNMDKTNRKISKRIIRGGAYWSNEASDTPKPHKVMTPEEYAAMPLKGWHEVCRDVDGFGGVGIRFLGGTHS